MKDIKFPYLRYLITPLSVKSAQYIYRPVIPVKLSLGKQTITFDGLIDSGADECTFPGWIAKILGHNLHKGNPKIFSGIGGSVLSYLHKTHMWINGNEFTVDVYYSHEWDDMPFGLLGQAGFFVHFDISFRYKKKEIVLKFK